MKIPGLFILNFRLENNPGAETVIAEIFKKIRGMYPAVGLLLYFCCVAHLCRTAVLATGSLKKKSAKGCLPYKTKRGIRRNFMGSNNWVP
jgi:hypothetical protein